MRQGDWLTARHDLVSEARPPPGALGSFSIVIGRALGTVVVTVRGELGASGATLLRSVLSDLILDQGNMSVALDLRKLRRLHRSAVDVLVDARTWARDRSGELRLYDPPTAVADLLAASGLSSAIALTASRPMGNAPPLRHVADREHTSL